MPQIVDYSVSKPEPDEIAAAGFLGAARYLAPLPNPKVINRMELAGLVLHGLTVPLVFESTATRVLGGAPAGDHDGPIAAAQIADLGWGGAFIFAAVDFDIQPIQYAAADAYFDAFGQHFRVEPYGKYDYIEYWCTRASVDEGGWQTAAWSGNGQGSGGSIDGRRVSKFARLYQRVGYVLNNRCDANDILKADYGQWPGTPPAPAPVPNPTPIPIPVPPEDDMAPNTAYATVGGVRYAFVVGTDFAAWCHRDGDPVGAFTACGGIWTSGLAAVPNDDGTVTVGGRGTDGALWELRGKPGADKNTWSSTSVGGQIHA